MIHHYPIKVNQIGDGLLFKLEMDYQARFFVVSIWG